MDNRINLQDLIDRCKYGERKAQELLYRHCYERLFVICMRYASGIDEAGIIYNEALLKVLTNIDSYSGAGPFEAWVRRIIVNTGIDHVRKEATFRFAEVKEEEQELEIDASVYAHLGANELTSMISSLNLNARLVFNMFVIEGYSHEEIAKHLGISAGTSRWQLNEARRMLRLKLQKRESVVTIKK